MDEKKRRRRVFRRSFFISSVILFCIIFGFLSAAEAYENTIRIGYGIYRPAVEWTDEGLRIFDLMWEF